MKTLLLPVAGQSSRFSGTRPKWMLTMPDGKLMIEKSVEGLDLDRFDRVIMVALAEHVERYTDLADLTRLLREGICERLEILLLDAPTSSQVETIAQALVKAEVEGSFFVKDCDNLFKVDYDGGNVVAVVDLHSVRNVDAGNKSYVQTDPLGIVRNIVEKHVIGNLFCCGGYGFESVAAFLAHWEMLKENDNLYLSHVIFSMIMAGVEFQTRTATGYHDWGTFKDYRAYCDRFLVVFCDIDGVLFKNSSKFAPGGWSCTPIEKNIAALRQIQEAGHLYLVVTTSRPPRLQAALEQAMGALGLHADQYVMGLPHAVRYLVNDYSTTNPYPSAVAINLERDGERLEALLYRQLAQ